MKKICENCKTDLCSTASTQYAITDPWNKNANQRISERICPTCGTRNEKLVGFEPKITNKKRPARQCGSNEYLVKNNSISL